MIPATLTLSGILADASTVVTEFDSLIVLVAGASVGMYVVKFLIKKVKGALR